jgi:hypothetical protein
MSAAPASTPTAPAGGPAARAAWRAVAIPSEHGGWGLTAEPVLLGLLLAPSVAGACLGVATVLAFLVRTPVRLVLVDRRRGRRGRVALVEATLLVALVGVAAASSPHPFWWPVAAAAPLVGVELWFDARSRSRRLVPELAGATGVSAAAAAIVVAGGHGAAEAVAAWLVLAARSATAIPAVRDQVARLHGRSTTPRLLVLGDAAAVALAAIAVATSSAALAGAVAVGVVIAVQRATAGTPVPAKVLGIRQTVLGVGVVVAAALGVHLS